MTDIVGASSVVEIANIELFSEETQYPHSFDEALKSLVIFEDKI